MFGFIKKVFVVAMAFFSFNVLSVYSLECISMKNQECKVREVIINIREVIINNEYMIYPFSIKIKKCSGNCNNISNPYSRMCVPNVIKNVTAKVRDLMSWKSKTKQINWHESCKCVYRSDPIICSNKRQKWNKEKCRCECLVDKKCDNKFFWNPSNCKCEYKKEAAHLLTEECEEIIDNKTVSVKRYDKTVNKRKQFRLL